MRKVAIALGVVVVLLVGAAFTTTAVLGVRNPWTLARIALADPSRQYEHFDTRRIAPADDPVAWRTDLEPLPDTVSTPDGTVSLPELFESTRTNAFLVVRNGVLVHEWYREGHDATTPVASFSVAKSIVSLLAGQSIAAGRLRESDLLVDRVPGLRGAGDYDRITVRDLLDHTSGIDVAENYDKLRPFTGTAGMYLTTDLRQFAVDHRAMAAKPGEVGDYRSVNTELLGQVVAEVEGKPLATLLSERIWQPIGAERPATWALDRDGGREHAYCCINGAPRDFARVGQLVLDSGMAQGRPVVPSEWVLRLRTPAPLRVEGWEYSAQWWHPDGGDDFTAMGIHGQFVYVNPTSRTVVVKFGDNPDERVLRERTSLAVMRALSS